MSDEVTIKTKFERQNQPKQFETARAAIELEITYPGSFTPEQISEDAKALFQVAKSLVFSELGLPFEQDSNTGIIMETFPGSTVVEMKATEQAPPRGRIRAVPQAPEGPGDDEGPGDASEAPEPATEAPRASRRPARPAPEPAPANDMTDEDYWEDLENDPGSWWDNRKTKTGRQPDFTSSKFKKPDGYRVALWLNRKPDWVTLPNESTFRPSASR